MPSCTTRRDDAVQRWPVEKKAPLTAHSTASSISLRAGSRRAFRGTIGGRREVKNAARCFGPVRAQTNRINSHPNQQAGSTPSNPMNTPPHINNDTQDVSE